MNTKESNVCQENTAAFYWVVARGSDCDGRNSGRVYPFKTYDKADRFRVQLQDSSDGIEYVTLCSIVDLMNYCKSFEHDYKIYLTVF